LDRDGTINVERGYVHRYGDWEWTPRAVDAIKKLNDRGLLVIVVSNQAGIARGLYSDAEVRLLHDRVDEELRNSGARIDAYYYCRHHPEHGEKVVCDCRKPAPGLLLKAQRDWDIDMHGSFMIGDKAQDVEAAVAANVRPILVRTGYGEQSRHAVGAATPVLDDLWAAAVFIESMQQ
jgi:D-glycero-D-manno-heptose 1,7-bisphosphate phosphatase